jgi:hypothetical protein
MVKNDFHHIWPCVKPFDGKVGQTIVFDRPHVVGVFVVVLQPITTFIPTKHNFHSIKSKDTRATNPTTCKNDQWKGYIFFETIPSMFKVIFYRQFFYILKGQILGGVPFDHNLHIPSFTLQNLETQAWGMYAISITALFWPPCRNPSFHTKSTFKKGDFDGFWILMDWDNGGHPML